MVVQTIEGLFDWERTEKLKGALEDAQLEDKESFIFEGRQLVVDYARYLVEYLESQLCRRVK